MNFFAFFFLLIVSSVAALPRYRRQSWFPQSNWGYNTNYQRGSGLWRFGGVGGPSGEGSTWEGASALGVSNNDISIFG